MCCQRFGSEPKPLSRTFTVTRLWICHRLIQNCWLWRSVFEINYIQLSRRLTSLNSIFLFSGSISTLKMSYSLTNYCHLISKLYCREIRRSASLLSHFQQTPSKKAIPIYFLFSCYFLRLSLSCGIHFGLPKEGLQEGYYHGHRWREPLPESPESLTENAEDDILPIRRQFVGDVDLPESASTPSCSAFARH